MLVTSRPPSCWRTIESSKAEWTSLTPSGVLILRKPLNVQSGQEDGHQGGVRYEAGDSGYSVLREWVLKQAELQALQN